MAAELINCVPVKHFAQVLIVPGLNLLYLVGGTEAVKEVQEGHLALDSGQMGHSAQVHDLLRGVGAEHGITGLAAGIHVGMVAEDIQGMGSHCTGGDVYNAGQ